jgi:hypothetical protein
MAASLCVYRVTHPHRIACRQSLTVGATLAIRAAKHKADLAHIGLASHWSLNVFVSAHGRNHDRGE